MAVQKTGIKPKTILKAVVVLTLILLLFFWAGWGYYYSDSAVKNREKIARRDACYADVKMRYTDRLRNYAQKQEDGSYQVPEQVKEKLMYLRKEEFRSCTELFPVD